MNGMLICYGWISIPLVYTQVAETLLNPWGEDDDDFDTYYLIDRNLQVSYIMADEAGIPIDPEMDPFEGSNAPELKHTNLSAQFLDDERPHMPTDNLNLTAEQTNIAPNISVKTSLLNLNIGSKLNLAGSILATPVTQRRRSGDSWGI